MGLCKCPKRKVTNLFCFVHRVNVCEDCMLLEHPRCVVHSYLKWLEDSDYEEVCVLCAQSIHHGTVVRLSCYDLLHENCLRSFVGAHMDGCHRCPSCKEVISPPSHFVSPVADQLRHTFQRMGLLEPTRPVTERKGPESASVCIDEQHTSTPVTQWRAADLSRDWKTTEPTREWRATDEEDKYRKKSWSRGMRHWLRQQQSQKVLDGSMYRLLFGMALLAVLAVTVIVLLTRVGREVARTDTSLDWDFNPNLRTGN